MKPETVTTKAILDAANSLDGSGQKPTLAAVREIVGGGSYTKISQVMAEWRKAKATASASPPEPVPSSVLEVLQAAGSQIWAAALAEAAARFALDREALSAEREEIEAARLEAIEVADQMGTELEQARAELAEAQRSAAAAHAQVDALRAELQRAQVEAAALKARVDEGEGRAKDLKDALERMSTNNQELISALRVAATPAAPAPGAARGKPGGKD